MSWHSILVVKSSGDVIASSVLKRANDPVTWSLETLGAVVFWQRGADSDEFFFCPRASTMFEPLIAANAGHPCDSPLVGSLRRWKSSQLALGFKTDWRVVTRPAHRQRARLPSSRVSR